MVILLRHDSHDVVRTVQGAGDHGSLNSRRRDHFWVPNTDETARAVDKGPKQERRRFHLTPIDDAVEKLILVPGRPGEDFLHGIRPGSSLHIRTATHFAS